MSRVAVITPEVVSAHMAGPAIRAWNMASHAAACGNDVRLVSTAAADLPSASFDVRTADADAMAAECEWADVIVTHPAILRTHPVTSDSDRPVVVDIYDPFHLENLEPGVADGRDRTATVEHLNSVISDALLRGDYFLCASERQRDFWLGSLTTLGRVNPRTYDADPTMEQLIGIVPFGIDEKPPQHRRSVLRGVVPGIAHDDVVLLWAGGVYDWFDPVTLVEAIDVASRRVPNLRLVFMGMGHPNPAIPQMRAAVALRERADILGLTGSHVFFNEGWVPYDERSNYLLEADIGVSTHLLHVETAFAFRTRVLDYLWAGLPTILSEGDVFAAMSVDEGFGVTAPSADVDALAEAIVSLALDESHRRACSERARATGERFTWSRVLAPLIAFCEAPRIAADRAITAPKAPTPPGAPAPVGTPRRLWRRR